MKGVLLLTVLFLINEINGGVVRNQLDPRCPPINGPVDVLLPAEDCQHFYKCNHGVAVLIPCPVNQEWAQHLQRCDWPEVAQCSIQNPASLPPCQAVTTTTSATLPPCQATQTQPSYSPIPGATTCPPVNGPVDVLLPAEDCQHFYKCNHGVPVLMPCPVNQEWAQNLQRCDWPEVAQCSASNKPSTPVDSTTATPCEPCQTATPAVSTTAKPASTAKPTPGVPGPNGCPAENGPDDVLLPAEDCQHFYKCNHGEPVLQECPEGLEWSQALLRCDWPEIAQCSGNITPSPKPSTPKPTVSVPCESESTQKPVSTPKPTPVVPGPNGCPTENGPDDVLLPAEDCQHFYKCNHGEPVLQECPEGLEWSQGLLRCDWPEIAQCSGGIKPSPKPSSPKPTVSTPSKPTSTPKPTPAVPGPNGCPAENGPDDVLLPAEDCQHFYKCNHGEPVLQECPEGLEWSQDLLRCDWPEVAQCSGGVKPSPKPSSPKPTVSTPSKPASTPKPAPVVPGPNDCPAENGPDDVLLPAEDCQHFYKCNHGEPVLQECPEGLEWSQDLLRCDWPEVAQCSGNVKPSPKPSTPKPTESVPCETESTQKPVSTPKPTPVVPEPNGCPAENGPDDVLLPAEDCQHFYKCNHGEPVLQECPEGLEWSQDLLRCDWPEVAQCSGNVKPSPKPSTPKQTVSVPCESESTLKPVSTPKPTPGVPGPNGCPAENGSDDVLLPAEDCLHFYKCNHGEPVLQECPEGLEWSQALLRCDWPEVAQCSGSMKPSPKPSSPKPTPSKPASTPKPTPSVPGPNNCPAENGPDDVLLPAEDCQHFYKCNYGTPVLQVCPEGLEWSQALLRCEWPEVAQCSGNVKPSPKPSTPFTTTTLPPCQEVSSSTTVPPCQPCQEVTSPIVNSCPAEDGPDDVLLPAEDCQHFYKCNYGKPVLQECPEGLEWSQDLLRCDWPEVAQCSVSRKSSPKQSKPKKITSLKVASTPNECPAEDGPDDILLPAEDCQHFYKCNYGKPVLQSCPAGLEWSQALLRCDWPEIANCT